MARLVDVYRPGKQVSLSRRQLPLYIDDTITMVMDLNYMGFICDNPTVRGKELEEFTRKYNVMTHSELKKAFSVGYHDLMQVLSQTVPCVGCRRSVERLFAQLAESGQPTLDPLVITSNEIVSVRGDQLELPQALCTMLHDHSARLSNLVENQPRSKKSLRCGLHTLDSTRSRPSASSSDWREVWECMQPQCRKEVLIIKSATLLARLNDYLRKHRFCGECRTKVLRAYTLLTEEADPSREKGYVAALYSGIRRCLPEKHLHLQSKTEFISDLITRAEPELIGRERHAKTMETAQEEVLTCLGLCIYDRLYKIHTRLREEQSICQVLAAVAVETLCRNFEMAVDVKRGVSQLELLYEQITKEEIAKQHRKEHKKQKRRRRKEKKVELDEKENSCECDCEDGDEEVGNKLFLPCACSDSKPTTHNNDRHKLQVLDRKTKGAPLCNCEDCLKKKLETTSISNLADTVVPNNKLVLEEMKKTQKVSANQMPSITSRKAIHLNSRRSGSSLPSNSTKKKKINAVKLARGSPEPSCQSCKVAQDGVEECLWSCVEHPGDKVGLWSSSEHSQDCGYSSENTNGSCDIASGTSSLASSPEGSEIACSDAFCNHEGDWGPECHKGPRCGGVKARGLTLQQMLEVITTFMYCSFQINYPTLDQMLEETSSFMYCSCQIDYPTLDQMLEETSSFMYCSCQIDYPTFDQMLEVTSSFMYCSCQMSYPTLDQMLEETSSFMYCSCQIDYPTLDQMLEVAHPVWVATLLLAYHLGTTILSTLVMDGLENMKCGVVQAESSPSDEEESCIPPEEVSAFLARVGNVAEERLELRQLLKKKFDQMCSSKFLRPPRLCASN
uniref:Gametogenetin-binding protein 2-like n=1 Tax=Timema tahoe TaxID=61484 RepID=A0A7R9FJY5_9NEOP|nr:unnamed protein product [Timema tahoe]